MSLDNVNNLDGISLYNIACLCSRLQEYPKSLSMLEQAVEAGFSNTEAFSTDSDLDPLRGMSEFQALMREVEQRAKSNG